MAYQFELIERLGRGGMGAVWKARDRETGQIVALEVIHSIDADEPGHLARFEREAEIMRRIDSPFVVKVLGYGQQDGLPYLAMEYVEGQSLEELLEVRGKLAWEETRAILVQVCEGLEAAHRVGVIHGDVKPSNILLTRDGTAKLGDFGIARAADLTDLTGSSTMLGTPHYMAPEGKPSVQSDLYALGCVAYEALAGRPVFDGDSAAEVLSRHIREVPDLALVPAAARPLLHWLLEKAPGGRPASAGEVGEFLGGFGVKRAATPGSGEVTGSEVEGAPPASPRWFIPPVPGAPVPSPPTRTVKPPEPDWIHVPAGEFTMGEDPSSVMGRIRSVLMGEITTAESKAHPVKLGAYSISRLPVTNAEYWQFVEATGGAAPEHWRTTPPGRSAIPW